jgi:hypothetical protein
MTSRQWFWTSNIVSLACCVVAAIGMADQADGWGWFLLGAVLTAKSPPGYASCSCKGSPE